jgi:hypothetical protein
MDVIKTIRAGVAATALERRSYQAMPRRNSHSDSWEFGGAPPLAETAAPKPKPRMRRAATTLAFTALFFSGAAITAVAGDNFSHMSAEDAALEETTTTDAATPEAAPAPAEAPAEAPAPEAAPATDPASAPAADAPASDLDDVPEAPGAPAAGAEAAAPESAPAEESAPAANGGAAEGAAAPAGGRTNGRAAKSQPSKVVLLPALKPAPAPEIEGPPAGATVWLNSALPDPTPAAKRLSPAFARQLTATAKGTGLNWAFLLGVLRAKGATGKAPANGATLAKLGNRLADMKQDRSSWATALAYGRSGDFADHAIALARYDRAVGLDALVHGLESQKNALGARLLADPQVSIYGGGRQDIVKGRVDVRVLALISYLHEAYGSVSVSCLISGHRLYARPGVVSAHIYGRAVDIAALGGQSILGNSSPGGLTEHAVRDIMLLPPEVMPQQVISLIGLGGPSFPLANHADHIHVGF